MFHDEPAALEHLPGLADQHGWEPHDNMDTTEASFEAYSYIKHTCTQIHKKQKQLFLSVLVNTVA